MNKEEGVCAECEQSATLSPGESSLRNSVCTHLDVSREES